MSRGPDAGTLVRRSLERYAQASGHVATVTTVRSTRWASATFVGARHRLTLEAVDDPALDAWLHDLPEADLPLRRHLVAELAIESRDRGAGHISIVLEVLTVETSA